MSWRCSLCDGWWPTWEAAVAHARIDHRDLQPCGTHAAFNRHRAHDEDPCEDCRVGERYYQRDRKRIQRLRLAGAV